MLVFDTHKFYQQLEQVGFTKEQAEKVTDLVRETQSASFSEISTNLATKADLGAIRADLEAAKIESKTDLAAVKAELGLKIAEVKVDLIKWFVTLLLAQTGILAALVKLL